MKERAPFCMRDKIELEGERELCPAQCESLSRQRQLDDVGANKLLGGFAPI